MFKPPGSNHQAYHIAGVKVLFPFKPYSCQLIMMERIIRGLKSGQNCLLESPTGSGKSLALLCSSLAWQREQIEKAKRYNRLIDEGITDPDILAQAAGLPPPSHPRAHPSSAPAAASSSTSAAGSSSSQAHTGLPAEGGFFYDDNSDDFISQEARRHEIPEVGEVDDMDFNRDPERTPKRLRVPKIFLGTRTHKQITQLVKELRTTAYNDVKMTVLSSREFSCIHPIVSTSSNKNEGCENLSDPLTGVHTCTWHNGANFVKTHDRLAHKGLEGAWDIEDLVGLGERVKACPYFTARNLMWSAELVICPYNYLVDPIIREQMNISVKNHIVILDEAHNIEGCSQEAASCTITEESFVAARHYLEKRTTKQDMCQKLAVMLSSFIDWMNRNKDKLTISSSSNFGELSKIFSGTEFIAILDDLDIGTESYPLLQKCYSSISHYEPTEPPLSPIAKSVLSNIFKICKFLLMGNLKYKDDYNIVLQKTQVRKQLSQQSDRWLSSRSFLDNQYSVSFHCLNPGIAFGSLASDAHSIILTSGTLSPLTTFESELGVTFKLNHEATHVINDNQVFVGSIGWGPTGSEMISTYKNKDLLEFQDDLGRLVMEVCHKVPGGILCFVSSYTMQKTLHERWQNTGLWDEITNVKEAMIEKRGSEAEKDYAHFYATIKNSKIDAASRVNGAFLLAVFRGNFSEGMDFSDDNARAVIAVGIPYPSMKNVKINLKQKYNNSCHLSRKLLSGNEWYEVQAFRAINQALGRCIRHIHDWGALILVDVRFRRGQKYTNKLSKWVRNKIVHHNNFSTAIERLENFVKNMMVNPPALAAPSNVMDKAPLPTEKMNLEITESTQTAHTQTHEAHTDQADGSLNCTDTKELMVEARLEGDESWCRTNNGSSNHGCQVSLVGRKDRERLFTISDDEDLDDFNLALSPSVFSTRSSQNLTQKKKKKEPENI